MTIDELVTAVVAIVAAFVIRYMRRRARAALGRFLDLDGIVADALSAYRALEEMAADHDVTDAVAKANLGGAAQRVETLTLQARDALAVQGAEHPEWLKDADSLLSRVGALLDAKQADKTDAIR
jgi:hypothetical protein